MSENPFASLQSISSRTRKIKLALPEDVLSTRPQWSAEQMAIPLGDRGAPFNGYHLELREGAASSEITIRRLTASQQRECEKIVDSVLPPVKTERKMINRGEPPVEVAVGWDDENPEYLERRRDAKDDQTALVVLYGVEGLCESTEGQSSADKIKKLRETLDQKLILYIAEQIWSWGYSAGDPSDFFTNANSGATPS